MRIWNAQLDCKGKDGGSWKNSILNTLDLDPFQPYPEDSVFKFQGFLESLDRTRVHLESPDLGPKSTI